MRRNISLIYTDIPVIKMELLPTPFDTEMGLPADRITLSAMSSPEVRGNEVHVYVR